MKNMLRKDNCAKLKQEKEKRTLRRTLRGEQILQRRCVQNVNETLVDRRVLDLKKDLEKCCIPAYIKE